MSLNFIPEFEFYLLIQQLILSFYPKAAFPLKTTSVRNNFFPFLEGYSYEKGSIQGGVIPPDSVQCSGQTLYHFT